MYVECCIIYKGEDMMDSIYKHDIMIIYNDKRINKRISKT